MTHAVAAVLWEELEKSILVLKPLVEALETDKSSYAKNECAMAFSRAGYALTSLEDYAFRES